jgi:hypothetical protein
VLEEFGCPWKRSSILFSASSQWSYSSLPPLAFGGISTDADALFGGLRWLSFGLAVMAFSSIMPPVQEKSS